MTKRVLLVLLGASLALNVVLYLRLNEQPVTPLPNEEQVTDKTSLPSFESGSAYTFLRVVDGDTITVGTQHGTEYVRLIGIDAPEPNDPGGPECYANEATAHLREIITTGTVVLIADPSQGLSDRYNRLLAYVELPDGTDLSERMLADGYVHEYTYQTPYERLQRYKAAEEAAMNEARGLWADSACAPTRN